MDRSILTVPLTKPAPEASVNKPVAAASVRNPSWWMLFRRYIDEQGLRPTLDRVLRLVLRPCYRSSSFWLLISRTDAPMLKIKPLRNCVIRRATPADLDLLATGGFQRRSQLAALLGSLQEVCFLAEWNGQLMGFQWAALGPRRLLIDPMGLSLQLHQDEAYLYNCRVLRAYRAKGVIIGIEDALAQWLASRGFMVVSTDIRTNNGPSLQTFERLGWRKVERVRLRQWFGLQKLECDRPRDMIKRPLHVMTVGRANGSPTLAMAERLSRHIRIVSASDGGSACPTDRVDLVHGEGLAQLPAALDLARRPRVARVTIALDEPAPGRPLDERLRRMLQRCDQVFVNSDDERAAWMRAAGVAESQVTVLESAAPALGDQAEARRALALPAHAIVVCAGLPHEVEPLLALLELAKQLAAEEPEARMLLLGDGPHRMMLRRLLDERGLAGPVAWLRRDPPLRAALAAADLVVEPDRLPSWPGLYASAVGGAVARLRSSPASSNGSDALGISGVLALLRDPARLQAMRDAHELEPQHMAPRVRAARLYLSWRQLTAQDLVPHSSEAWRLGHVCAALGEHAS